MNFAQERNPARQMAGFGLVVLLHLGLIYLIVSGLANRAMEVIKGPLEAKIIQETKPPPPDLPPPPPPDLAPPPPPFIPPPEINIQQPIPPTNAIRAVTTEAPPAPVAPAPVQAAPPPPAVPDQDVSARPIAGDQPKYPERLKKQGREGYALVECTVDATGTTSECKLDEVHGGDDFGDAAMIYVKQARYHPAIHNGQPVTQKHQWRIDFKLN